MSYKYYIYILTNEKNTVFYIGITNNISRRIYEHKNHLLNGFTKKYNIDKLVYCEVYDHIYDAIYREKQLKNWKRQWKIDLIKQVNPNFEEKPIFDF